MNKTALAILVALSALIALADDLKTIAGKEYKNVTVSRVEPDGILVISKSGILKLYFTELPKDVQERFGYDPDKAREYEEKQNKALEETQKQQAQQMQQAEQEKQKNNQDIQAGKDALRQWQNVQSLQDNLMLLRQQKAQLEQTIQDRQKLPRHLFHVNGHRVQENPARADLHSLQDQLNRVNHTIEQAQEQLRQVQEKAAQRPPDSGKLDQKNPAMKQAEAVKDKYVNELMALPGVQGVGIGAGPSIVVYVIKDTPTKPTLPTNLEGIPVRVKESGKFRPL